MIDKIFYFLSQSKLFNRKNILISNLFQNSIFYNSIIYKILSTLYSSIFNIYSIILTLFFYLIIIPYHFLPPIKDIPIAKLIPIFILLLFYILSFIKIDNKKIYKNRYLIFLILCYIFIEFLSSLNFALFPITIINFVYFEYTFFLIFLFFINSNFKINRLKIIFIFFITFVTIAAIYGDFIIFLGEPSLFTRLLHQKLEAEPSMRIIYKHFSPSSAFGNGSMRATLISMLIPIFLTYIYFKKDAIKNILFLMLFIIILFSIILCKTTGSFVALFLTLIVQFFIFYKNKIVFYFSTSKKLILSAIIIMLISIIFFLFNSHDFSIVHRLIQWRVASNIFVKHPLIGIGVGNYSHYADNFRSYYDNIQIGSFYNVADNYILTYIVEHGIIGTILILLIFSKIIKKIKYDNIYSVSIFSMLIYIFFNSLTWDIGNHLTFRIIFIVFLSIFYLI